MSTERAKILDVGDKLDHRDFCGKFCRATIIQKVGTNFQIHYDGWEDKWNEWSDFSVQPWRFAEENSISSSKWS